MCVHVCVHVRVCAHTSVPVCANACMCMCVGTCPPVRIKHDLLQVTFHISVYICFNQPYLPYPYPFLSAFLSPFSLLSLKSSKHEQRKTGPDETEEQHWAITTERRDRGNGVRT